MYDILFASSRSSYVGKAHTDKPRVDCMFCAIRDKDPRVWTRLVYQNAKIIVLMNIFPYSPGHLQVIPTMHVKDLKELSDDDLKYALEFVQKTTKFVKTLIKPQGFNIGINLGRAGGASIEHLHFQIVPRYVKPPKLMEQEVIHKLYLDHLYLLLKPAVMKSVTLKRLESCKCFAKSRYVLNSSPTIILAERPYNRGHLIIAPSSHVSEIDNLILDDLFVIFKSSVVAKEAVEKVYSPLGFNIGLNTGKVPNTSGTHLKLHLVPRYEPESGFMEVVGNTRVIIESLEQAYEKLKVFYSKTI